MKHETQYAYKKLCRIKAKMYMHITEDNQECKKTKGINKNVADDKLKYEDCKNILYSGVHMRHAMD